MKLKKITIEEAPLVQSILDTAPTYYMLIEGVPKIEGIAEGIFKDLPPNCTLESKHVHLIELDHGPIGIAETIIGYPNAQTAFLGLFLINEAYHGKGLGRAAYELWEGHIKNQFPEVHTVELGVNDTNHVGMGFWSKLGFVKNGRSRINQGKHIQSTVYVLAKKIEQG